MQRAGAVQAVPRLGTVVKMRSGWLLLAFVAALHLGTARAEMASANLQVSAQVLPHAQLQADTAPVIGHRGGRAARLPRRVAPLSAADQRTRPRGAAAESADRPHRLDRCRGTSGAGAHRRLEPRDHAALAREFTLNYRLWLRPAAMPANTRCPCRSPRSSADISTSASPPSCRCRCPAPRPAVAGCGHRRVCVTVCVPLPTPGPTVIDPDAITVPPVPLPQTWVASRVREHVVAEATRAGTHLARRRAGSVHAVRERHRVVDALGAA